MEKREIRCDNCDKLLNIENNYNKYELSRKNIYLQSTTSKWDFCNIDCLLEYIQKHYNEF